MALTTNLIAYWKFDSNTTDTQGGYNGTLQNDAAYATGKFGNALSLDGTGDHMAIPVAASTGSYDGLSGSISAWVYPTANSNYETIFMHGRNTSIAGANYANFGYGSGGKLRYRFGNNNQIDTWTSAGTVPLNQWSHVVITSDGAPVKFYINGVQSATSGRTDLSWWINNLRSNSHDISTIGCAMWGGPYPTSWSAVPHWEFEGKIDDFAIWGRALTDAEILDIYTRGDGGQALLETAAAIDGSGFRITVV